MFRKLALTLVLSTALTGCNATGGVDWDKVGTIALGTVAVVAVVGAAVVGAAAMSEPAYYAPPPITCTSYGSGYMVTTTCR